mgnify:CR=1 FL=1
MGSLRVEQLLGLQSLITLDSSKRRFDDLTCIRAIGITGVNLSTIHGENQSNGLRN